MNVTIKFIFLFLVITHPIAIKISYGARKLPDSPETLILDANLMLQGLNQNFDSIKTIRKGKGFHINYEEASVFFEKGNLFYDQNIPYAALYWYSKYLNLIQMPPPSKFLHIQKNLFFIFSQTRQFDKSFKAAKKYTTTFLTTPDQNFSDLESILRKFYQDLSYSNINKKELNSFISGFSSIEFPNHVRFQLVYLIAKIAFKSGLHKTASQWLANASAFTNDPKLFERIKIFQAIIAIRLNKLARAHHILTNAVDQVDQGSDLWSFYKLFLGRLNFVLRKPKLAISNYLSIPSNSPAHSDSIFELCFLYATSGQWEQAKAQASLYLGTNKKGTRTNIIRRLIPFLDMQAGHFDQANTNILAALESINKIEKSLQALRKTNSFSSFESLKGIERELHKIIGPPPLSHRLKKLDSDLIFLSEQASSLEGNLKFSLHSISKAKITSFNPDLHHHYLQLLAFGSDLLKVGHMLATAEKFIFNSQLSRAEEVQLEAIWNRRRSLLSEKHRFLRKSGPMRTETVYLEKNSIVAKLWDRMQKINAMLTASKHMLEQDDIEKKNALEKSVTYLEDLSSQVNQQVSSLINSLRESRFENQANVFSNIPEKVFFSKYAKLLKDESDLYTPYRSLFKTARDRIQSQRLTASWGVWNDLTQNLNKDLTSLELEVKRNINNSIKVIGTLQKELASQKSLIQRSKMQFQNIVASSIPYIADFYLYQIAQLRSRYKKWLADIKWNQYDIIKASETGASAIFEAEKMQFENSLFDIKNGILETWKE